MRLQVLGALVAIGMTSPNAAEGGFTAIYDGAGGASPTSQGQLLFGAINSSGIPVFPLFPLSDFETSVAGGVQVDSDARNAEYAGYSNYNPISGDFVNPAFPTLRPGAGFVLEFGVSLDSVSDASENRAAFSVTVITNDGTGIEIGLDADRVFAQSDTFVRAETSGAIDTSTMNTYRLVVQNNGYELFADTGAGFASLLAGGLRSYIFDPQASSPPLPLNPYETENLLFFGDNTGQADGLFTFKLARLGVIPTPSTSAPFALAFAMTLRRRRVNRATAA